MALVRLLPLAGALGLVACMKKTDAPPPPASKVTVDAVDAVAPPAPAPAAPSATETAETSASADASERSAWKPGARVVVRGTISNAVSQHLSRAIAGKRQHELAIEGGGRIVVHAASLPACQGLLELRGTVVELRAPPGSKAGDGYRELQIDVDDARCVR